MLRLCLRQVSLRLVHFRRDYKKIPLMTGFLYAHVMFKTGFSVLFIFVATINFFR